MCQPLAVSACALEELCESVRFLWGYCVSGPYSTQLKREGSPSALFFLLFLNAGKPQMIWVRLCAFCSCPLNGHMVLSINYNQKNAVYLYWLNWNNSASSLEVLVPHHLLSIHLWWISLLDSCPKAAIAALGGFWGFFNLQIKSPSQYQKL